MPLERFRPCHTGASGCDGRDGPVAGSLALLQAAVFADSPAVTVSLLQLLQRLYFAEDWSVMHSVSGSLSHFGLVGIVLSCEARLVRVEALRLLACGTAALRRHSGKPL